MQNLLNILNAGSVVITAFATVVLAIITWRYVKLTKEMLGSGDKPEILIYLFPSEVYSYKINLCIQNIGTGFASDIQFSGKDLSFIPRLFLGKYL